MRRIVIAAALALWPATGWAQTSEQNVLRQDMANQRRLIQSYYDEVIDPVARNMDLVQHQMDSLDPDNVSDRAELGAALQRMAASRASYEAKVAAAQDRIGDDQRRLDALRAGH